MCVCVCVGYLKEEGCIASYRLFLKEMKHLAEYRTLLEAGCEYPTSICGKSLKIMLNDYGNMVLSGKWYQCIELPCCFPTELLFNMHNSVFSSVWFLYF